jgi:UDP-glucose 4-epimerase
MDKWAKMDIPLQLAKEIRHKLKSIGKDYNTEDGQIRWLDYNGYDLHL